MKSWNNLWDNFLSEDNIRLAIKNAARGKVKKRYDVKRALKDVDGYVKYIKHYAENFRNDKHNPIEIYDGITRKKRTIIVPTFRELVVQHMLINVLKPVFLQGVYERTYGSIPKRGAHEGKKYIEKWIRHDVKNCKYCLKLDIKKYFENISHDILKTKLSRVIKDKKILSILYEVINATDNGLPLGFYTSQWLSMWYLKDFDHYVKEKLYAPHYMRYADDIVIFGANKRKLWKTFEEIKKYLGDLGLELNRKSQMFRFVYTKHGMEYGRDLDFMGFRFFRNRTIIRRSIYYKMMRKARKISKKSKITIFDIRQMLSYLGWLKSTDVYKMYVKYIKPFFEVRKAKKRISNYDRRKARYELEKSKQQQRHKTA